MYFIECTGGEQEALVEEYASFDEMAQSLTYNNIREFVDAATGERVDIYRVDDHGNKTLVESYTG